MIGYTDKDIEAVAMLRPVAVTKADQLQNNVDKFVAKARLERSMYIGGLIRKTFGGTAGTVTVIASAILGFLKKLAAEFKASREALKAADRLFAMTPAQLEDLGLSYRDIDAAVYGRNGKRSKLSAAFIGLVKDLPARFNQWRKDRTGYGELMALDDRTLADLGICRGEIAAVAKYGRDAVIARRNDNANDNMNTTAANDDHRQAV